MKAFTDGVQKNLGQLKIIVIKPIMMKNFIFISLIFLELICAGEVRSQILHPVKWSYAYKKINAQEIVIFLKATIDDGWHIYSTAQKDGGPVKTSFAFNTSKEYDLDGSILEPVPVTKYEKAFEMDVLYFENSVVFQQKIKLNTAQTLVKGNLKFMVCNDHQCLPPETISYSIPIN